MLVCKLFKQDVSKIKLKTVFEQFQYRYKDGIIKYHADFSEDINTIFRMWMKTTISS